MDKRLTVSDALQQLEHEPKLFKTLFTHGSMEVEIYRPVGEDKQQPHTRDELYVIASGSGFFWQEGNRHPVEVGEVLFVAAGQRHRFEDFSDDFSTWVVFYGPEGGES